MSKKSTCPPDPRVLARRAVDEYLAVALSLNQMLDGDAEVDGHRVDGPWSELLEAIGAKETRLRRGYDESLAHVANTFSDLDERQAVYGLTATAAEAGFLVGLELGRRIGGAR